MRFQLKREWVIPTVVGVVSFVAGVGAEYGFRRFREEKINRNKKAELGATEIESEDGYFEPEHVQLTFEFDDRMRQFNRAIQEMAHVVREFKERGSVYLAELDSEGLHEARHAHPSNGDNVVNIFPVEEDDWDYDVEVPLRTPDKPYIIHVDEYMDKEEVDNRQSTLTYYDGDNILCDTDDTPVYDVENIVGFLRFGHGSKDPNVCYVRNERLMAEYEILRDPGYYQVQILGEALEEKDLKHSKQLPKFRME